MTSWDSVVAIVPGGSNTDLVMTGVRPAAPGELVTGGRFTVGPGGKSRNVAQMMATYMGPGTVAFLGRTLAPPRGGFEELDGLLGATTARGGAAARSATVVAGGAGDVEPYVHALLAQVPLAALRRSGVVTDFVVQVAWAGTAAGVAEILVSPEGENTIYLASGVNADFCPADVDAASPVFEAVGRRARAGAGGIMPLALEIPLATAVHAARKARENAMTVVLDPGGIAEGERIDDVLRLADVVKPNEHEARMLTGVEVADDASAARAARVLRDRHGIHQAVITAGARGAWHVGADGAVAFYPAYRPPRIADTTGCGDQFMAVMCCHLATDPSNPASALRHAIVAAALQAARVGIQPVARDEVVRHVADYRGA